MSPVPPSPAQAATAVWSLPFVLREAKMPVAAAAVEAKVTFRLGSFV